MSVDMSMSWYFLMVVGRTLAYYIYLHQTSMRQHQPQPSREIVHEDTPTDLRRSRRERREPKNDDYFMGYNYLEDVIGGSYQDEDYYPKRRRKNYRYDDSEDYSEGHKYHKKSKLINLNKIESLLEWKFQLLLQPITVIPLPDNQDPFPLDDFHKTKLTKSIPGQNLAAIGDNIQALFINIDWHKKHQTLKDFQQLKIESNKFMSKGLVFVWAPKAQLSQLLSIMQAKGFVYVQNFEVINFDIEKAGKYLKGATEKKQKNEENTQSQVDFPALLRALENVNPCDIIADEPSEYFNVSKRTLLMFKKNNNSKFELRHQRTCDVVFDMPLRLGEKCAADIRGYIYNMIQTLLPECLVVQQRKKNEFGFKMMELWAQKDQPRRGWINVVQQ